MITWPVLVFILSPLLAIIGFFFTREFSGRDRAISELQKVTEAMRSSHEISTNELRQTNIELMALVHELRAWALDHFMKRADYVDEHHRLEERISERFEQHERNCPALKRIQT